jgi:hypothetical protein
MIRNYSDRLDRLIERRTAPVAAPLKKSMASAKFEQEVYQATVINEAISWIEQEGKATRYAFGAMEPVDQNYTRITYEQGERIQNQLSKAFEKCGIECDFDYQGSVPCDIHIKAHSDIDMLAITRRFINLERPQVPIYPYTGNPVEDLREIRTGASECLKAAFPTATIDTSGRKSISIEGGSLSRKVDIVPANWFDTNTYKQTREKRDRGVMILDHKRGAQLENYPFLHIERVKTRDHETAGGLRKIVRLMKSLKYDSENHIKLTSYDIVGIAYAIPTSTLIAPRELQLSLLYRLKQFLDHLAGDEHLRNSIQVPDGTRKVFGEGYATKEQLAAMQDEVDDLVEAVAKDLNRSFEKLAEARITFRPQTPIGKPHFQPLRARYPAW